MKKGENPAAPRDARSRQVLRVLSSYCFALSRGLLGCDGGGDLSAEKRMFGESAMAGRTDLMYREVMAKFAVYAMLLQMPWRGRQELGGRKDWELFNTVGNG